MRLNVLIDKNGVVLNPEENNFINASSVDGDANYSLLENQISIECLNAIKTSSTGKSIPDYTSVVNSGLSGTLTFRIFPSKYAPYSIPIQMNNGVINIGVADASYLQFTGILESLDITATGITGCNYINILVDRN